MREDRDHVKAGAFVALALLLAFGVALVLSGPARFFEDRDPIVMRVGLAEGLQGLKEGARVTLGDQPVGRVVRIEDEMGEEGWRVVGKRVTLSLPARYALARDAVIELKSPLIGGQTRVNIASVGAGERYDPERDPPLAGRRAPLAAAEQMARQAGIDTRQREQIQQIIADLHEIARAMRARMPRVAEKLEKLMDEARPAATDLREGAGAMQTMFETLRERSAPWFDRIDRITRAADSSLGRLDGFLEKEEPALRGTIRDARAVARGARQRLVPRASEMLEKAKATLARFEEAGDQTQSFIRAQRPVLERTLANAALTSDQLKLAAIEIRRAPWRLLHEPTEAELESDNLYDAARSFALGASALLGTAQSLRAMAERRPDDPRIEQLLDYLERLTGKFQEAEAAFWEAAEQAGR